MDTEHNSVGNRPDNTSSRRSKKAPTLSTEAWMPYKDRVLQLHINEGRPLREVREIMMTEAGFDANERQYRTRISQWNKDKNIKPREMRAIVRKRQHRALEERDKLPLRFRVRSRPVTEQQILRWMTRNNVSDNAVYTPSSTAATPRDVDYETASNSVISMPTPQSPALDEPDEPEVSNQFSPRPLQGESLPCSSTFSRVLYSFEAPSFDRSPSSPYHNTVAKSASLVDITTMEENPISASISVKDWLSHLLDDPSGKLPTAADPSPAQGSSSAYQDNEYQILEEKRVIENLRRAETTYGKVSKQYVELKLYFSSLLSLQARFREAEEMIKESVVLSQQDASLRRGTLAAALELLGGVFGQEDKLEYAALVFETILKMTAERTFDIGLKQQRRVTIKLACVYLLKWRLKQAEQMLLSVWGNGTGSDCPEEAALAAKELSCVYRTSRQLDKAEQMASSAVDLAVEILSPCHWVTCEAVVELCMVYDLQGKGEAALRLLKSLVQYLKVTKGEEHHDTIWCSRRMVRACIGQGRWKEAEEMCVSLVEYHRKIYGQQHPETSAAIRGLALVYANLGRRAEAEILGEAALKNCVDVCGQLHINTLLATHNLALIYVLQDRGEDGQQLLERVVDGLQKTLDPGYTKLFFFIDRLSEIYREQGKWDELGRLTNIKEQKLRLIDNIAEPYVVVDDLIC